MDLGFGRWDLLNSSSDQLKLLGCASIFWWTLFFVINETLSFKSINKLKSDDTKNRIVSIIHGSACFFLTLNWLFIEDPQFGALNTNYQIGIIIVSTAYFFYDLVACFYYGLADFGCVSHHTMVLIGYSSALYQQYGATEALLGLFFAEVSNFPMHARVIARNFGLRYTKLYELFELLYMGTYITARSIGIPLVLWIPCITAEKCPIIVKIICSGLTFQSLYYVKEMYTILMRKLKQLKERNQKKISYLWLSETPKVKELSYANKEAKQNIF